MELSKYFCQWCFVGTRIEQVEQCGTSYRSSTGSRAAHIAVCNKHICGPSLLFHVSFQRQFCMESWWWWCFFFLPKHYIVFQLFRVGNYQAFSPSPDYTGGETKSADCLVHIFPNALVTSINNAHNFCHNFRAQFFMGRIGQFVNLQVKLFRF